MHNFSFLFDNYYISFCFVCSLTFTILIFINAGQERTSNNNFRLIVIKYRQETYT
jgi:hypothetical protein